MKKLALLFLICLMFTVACRKKQQVDLYGEPLTLITDPKLMPKFYDDFDKESLLRSVRKSIKYMQTRKTFFVQYSQQFSREEILESLSLFEKIILNSVNKEDFDKKIKDSFHVYISKGTGRNDVLFTGYYQPIISGSLTRTDRFNYPLYKRPKNLVKDVPYLTKRQIDLDGALKNQNLELVWVESYLMAHIVHVQGTAVIRLPNGKELNIGYHGDNGHGYTSIIKEIIKDGYIKQENISLESLENFFRKNPHLEEKYVAMNDRYIFFREVQGGPFGSLGIEVTPRRSLATHRFAKSEYLFPPCGIAFVDCQLPIIDEARLSFHKTTFFAINQDTGSAIRGAGRADIYFGVGDRAKLYAGYTHTEGKLYYLKRK